MAVYRRILLTGGAGFVGSHLAPRLAAAWPEAERVVLTRPGEASRDPAWRAVCANLVDEAAIDRLVAETAPDLVVHLAGQASIGQSFAAAETTWRVNFHGAFGLACALARHAPEATVFFASSASVYGESLRAGIADEETPLRPLDAYGRSKAAAEGALSDVLGSTARLIVARPVNHSGPGQNPRDFVLPSFAAQIAAIEAGRQPPVMRVGDLSRARDFLDVADVVDAYMAMIAAAPSDAERVRIFNVASGTPRSIQSLLDVLQACSPAKVRVEVDPSRLRPSDLPSVALDSTRLRAASGWRPRRPLEEMLAALLDHFRGLEKTSPCPPT